MLELTVLQPFPWPAGSQDRHKPTVSKMISNNPMRHLNVVPCHHARKILLHGMVEPILGHSLVRNKDRGSHFQQEMCCSLYHVYTMSLIVYEQDSVICALSYGIDKWENVTPNWITFPYLFSILILLQLTWTCLFIINNTTSCMRKGRPSEVRYISTWWY